MSTFDSCVEPDEDGTEFVAEVRCCRCLRLFSLPPVGCKAAEFRRTTHSVWLRWAEGRSSKLLACWAVSLAACGLEAAGQMHMVQGESLAVCLQA